MLLSQWLLNCLLIISYSLASILIRGFFSEDSSIKTYPKNSLHLSATSLLAIRYAREDFNKE